MASALGEYVHYHWSRYLKYGITRNEEQIAFNPKNLFINHKKQLNSMINTMQTFQIKNLEKEFNDLSEQTYNALVQCLKDPNRGKATLKTLLKLINKSWTDLDINKILKDIKIKESQHTISYEPKGKTAKQSQQGIGIKKLKYKQAHYYSTYLSKLEEIKNKIKMLEINDNAYYQKAIAIIEDQLENQKRMQKITEIFSKTKNNLLPPENRITILINTLITELQGIAAINSILQSQLAEIIGQLAVNGIANNIDLELKRMVQEASQMLPGRGLTKGSQVELQMTANLDQFWLKSEYENNSSIYQSHIVAVRDEHTNNILSYKFKDTATKVQQKADIIWEGVANISMKNTAFDDDYMPEDIIPSISLQGSNLRLFLEGIEASQAGLGTHYLNVLASHPNPNKNGSNNLTQLSTYAREVLLLQMLYSSLTGEQQNRIGQMTNILAIYDKKKKKGALQVKLFSMKDILKKLAPNISKYDGEISSPALSSFNLDNSYVGTVPDHKQATTRITKLIGETTINNVSIRLPKYILHDLTS